MQAQTQMRKRKKYAQKVLGAKSYEVGQNMNINAPKKDHEAIKEVEGGFCDHRGTPTRLVLPFEHWTGGALGTLKTLLSIVKTLVESDGNGGHILHCCRTAF